ncbi:MAG: hypothetical protein HY705_06270 [Gemmatimonadetes bacterium]|nr:hypothetical protein [Gemmatimonadota bacterium]
MLIAAAHGGQTRPARAQVPAEAVPGGPVDTLAVPARVAAERSRPALLDRPETIAPAGAVPLHRRAWTWPVASLLVPGSGQALAGQGRGLVYLATEVWALTRAVSLGREGRRGREHFQQLAFAVARRAFASRRRDGPFDYYETMGQFVESGNFDVDPGPGFEPEPDTTTFNGSVWLVARRTFFQNPDSVPDPTSRPYRTALAFYRARAVDGEFRWSWRDARLEQDAFRAAIHASDEAFRAATNYLGVLVINHVGSAVDALVMSRLGRRGAVPRVGLGDGPLSVTLSWHAGF